MKTHTAQTIITARSYTQEPAWSKLENALRDGRLENPTSWLDRPIPPYCTIVRASFPDQPARETSKLPGTLKNLRHLVRFYSVQVRYDVLRKKIDIRLPWMTGEHDPYSQHGQTELQCLLQQNRMSTAQLSNQLLLLASDCPFSPVLEYINRYEWDGYDRLPDLYATVTTTDSCSGPTKDAILREWLEGAVMKAVSPNSRTENRVLTLIGPRHLRKTKWLAKLVRGHSGEAGFFTSGQSVSKLCEVTLKSPIENWLIELSDLDKPMTAHTSGQLNAFINKDLDIVKRSANAKESKHMRRSVFAASVNDPEFTPSMTVAKSLNCLRITELDSDHQIEMQQVYAQLAYEHRASQQCFERESFLS